MGGLIRSFGYAFKGLGYVLRYERNGRIHLVFAVVVLVAGLGLRITDAELAAVLFAIIVVFLAEIFNTAIEKTLDLIDRNHNPQIMIIKDMAAGAVLVAATGAVAMGVVIFTPYLWRLWVK